MTQTAYINPNNGLRSIVEASEDYELAPLGIASMKDQAEKLAEFGRYGDVYVVHAARGETVIPMEVLEANPHIKSLLFNQMEEMGLDPNRYVVGNEFNSLNPVTGMPEFFFSKIFKKIKKAAKKVFKVIKKIAPIAIPIAASFFGFPAFMGPLFAQGTIGAAALGGGLGSLAGGGSLKDALKAAAIGGGLAGLTGGFKGLMKAPAGTGFQGFGAGVKAAATGVTPIYNAAGTLVGTQAAPSFGQTWDAVMGGDFTGALTGSGGTYTPTAAGVPGGTGLSAYNPATGVPFGASQYVAAPPVSQVPTSVSTTDWLSLGQDGTPYITDPVGTGLGTQQQYPFGSGADLGGSSSLTGAGGAGADTILGAPAQATEYINPLTKMPVTSATEYNELVTAGLLKPGPHLAPPATPLLGSLSPTAYAADLLGATEPIPNLAANVGDLALAGGATYLAGGFEPEPEEDPKETAAAAESVFDPIVIDPVLAQQSEIDVTTQIPTTTAQELLQPTLFSATGGSVEYPRRDLLVEGPGTEKSDDIPAMLSDGEFVLNSRAVRGADPSGRGNRYAGANNLYNLMRNFEMRA